MEERFVYIDDTTSESVPSQSVSEMISVSFEAQADDSGMVEIYGHFKILTSPLGAASLSAQVSSGQLQTRAAKVIFLLFAGKREWRRGFRRSLKQVIADARSRFDSID